MKPYLIFISLLFSGILYADEIVTYRMNCRQVYRISTYLDKGVTTVMFPGQIEGIAAGNVAMNKVYYQVNGTPACDFLMSFQPGNYYFSIRALKAGATGTVNVVYGRQTYILKFQENETEAMATVNFSDENGVDSEQDYRPPSGAVLKGLLDKAKSFDLLKEKYPGALSQVTVCNNKCISDYKDFTATIVRCWRFDNYNSLVFMVELKNKTGKTLIYKPEKTAFSVMDQHLYPACLDASGVMPPAGTSFAFFVVSGTADGRKNKFAADNDWQVVINAVPEAGK
ncbi:MAG: hypothetical protein PHV59_01600 [Victivallales bacterium]|nr:hypothetical protein [Victivallales bacterium]